MMASILAEDIGQFPFLYENTRMLQIESLQKGGQDHVKPIVLQLIQHLGMEKMQNLLFELKFEKKKEPEEKQDGEPSGEAEADANDGEIDNQDKADSNELSNLNANENQQE